ncbi:hypothetical protein J1792_02025 [Streptomyces triculaminicus]|uniref:Uncharacterized protein n=1 Tax=Streptomyces triculaminicus TaxID=2816232 RepID=A0A939FIC1_9ACTN|nr:hypothetical protein [Streptomyces triculaminicus]MBO0651624.1 hypothetical protein [Streptomyces triculaminicus]
MAISATRTERPVTRWAERTAHLIPLLGLPVCLWRLPIAFGYMMGIGLEPPSEPLWFTIPYVFGLSLLSEAFALLCFGLVRPWGEVVPRWIPRIGGRRVPPFAVIVPATLAGLGLTALLADWVLCTFGLAGFSNPDFDNAGWASLANTVSGLFVLWGPLVLAQTYGYYRRRCRPSAA